MFIAKRRAVRVLESATLLNLIVLSAGTLYKWESTESKTILLEVSAGITFAQVCIIIVLSFGEHCFKSSTGWMCRRSHNAINKIIDDDIVHERIKDPELEPLIDHAPQSVAMTASAEYTTSATKVSSYK